MSASLTYCGHSTVILTTEEGKRVIIDPFLKGNPKCPANLHDPGPIDIIVLTHGHGDHTGSVLELAARTGAKIFATYELCSLIERDGVPQSQFEPMNTGGTVRAGRLAVSLTHAFHSSSYTTRDGTTHYAGSPCGAIVRLESGRTIYHAGDTNLFGDMRGIAELYAPELALLPIGDRFTMGPTEAARAATLVAAPRVMPIHYDTFPALTGTAAEFSRALDGSGIEPAIVTPGATILV